MRIHVTVRVLLVLALVTLARQAGAHAEHDIPRYVSPSGKDVGRCELPVRPCRTIQYAASIAGKGNQVLVAGGAYEIRGAEDIFHLTSGVLELKGGFDRFDHFSRQAPDDNRTTLIGLPTEFREQMRARGFHVIADRKGLDTQQAEALRLLMKGLEATRQSSADVPCVGQMADSFACNNVDLLSHFALADFSSNPSSANDVWGFVDLNTDREYALAGVRNGPAVIDVSDPETPFEVGFVAGQSSTWRDIKVVQRFDPATARWNAHAYVTTDSVNDRLVIIDLTALPNSVALAARQTNDDSAHNVYISNVDYATGVPYEGLPPILQMVGSNRQGGAFRSYTLDNATAPVLLTESPGGYTHDASSLLITDARTSACQIPSQPCEVLLDFNETTIELWDFSNQANPLQLSSTSYPNRGYVHSGWWSEDTRYMFVHDELDERDNGLNTTLRVFDLSNLSAPALAGTWTGPTAAIDHNGYVRGYRYYMSNYTRGLTV